MCEKCTVVCSYCFGTLFINAGNQRCTWCHGGKQSEIKCPECGHSAEEHANDGCVHFDLGGPVCECVVRYNSLMGVVDRELEKKIAACEEAV